MEHFFFMALGLKAKISRGLDGVRREAAFVVLAAGGWTRELTLPRPQRLSTSLHCDMLDWRGEGGESGGECRILKGNSDGWAAGRACGRRTKEKPREIMGRGAAHTQPGINSLPDQIFQGAEVGVGNHLTPDRPGLRLATPMKRVTETKDTSHLPLGQTPPVGCGEETLSLVQ